MSINTYPTFCQLKNYTKEELNTFGKWIVYDIVKNCLDWDLEDFCVNEEERLTAIDIQLEKTVGHNENCPFSIRKDICYNITDKKEKKSTKSDPKEKWAEMYALQDNPQEFFKKINYIYSTIISKMHFIVVNGLKNIRIVPPNEKGSPSYNKRTRHKIVALAKVFSKHYKNKYLVTLTVDTRKFHGGVIDQHKQAVKYASLYCQELTRQLKGRYIIVNEEQRRGAIHFHLVFFTNMDYHTGNLFPYRTKKGSYIKYGKLREFNNRNWQWGHFDLQVATDEQAIYYCVKYISKKTDTDFWQLQNKKKLSVSDRKEIMGFVMPTLGGYRSWNSSRLTKEMRKDFEEIQEQWKREIETFKTHKRKEEALKSNKTRYKPLNDYVAKDVIVVKKLPEKKAIPQVSERERYLGAIAPYLIWLSDNSTFPCLKWLYSGNYGDLVKAKGSDFHKINEMSDSEKEKISCGCSPLGCGGCPIGTLLRDIVRNENRLFEKQDNRDKLKPLLWKVLSDEDKKLFTSFNFSLNQEIDFDIFADLHERIGEELVKNHLPLALAKNKNEEAVAAYQKGERLTLTDWRKLLTCQKWMLVLEGDKKIKMAVEKLFPTNVVSLFNPVAPIWQDTGFDEVFDLYKDWLEEQGLYC
ncbi:MAG: hypothetical protein IJF83_15090 [Methanobrevibacter sp.]|nr:hypothetical protein [Methanobrevibacter sp.]